MLIGVSVPGRILEAGKSRNGTPRSRRRRDHLVPWVSERPVSPRLPGGKDPLWQGFQCTGKKMERAVDEDHDFGGMCVKLVQVKRLGRVVWLGPHFRWEISVKEEANLELNFPTLHETTKMTDVQEWGVWGAWEESGNVSASFFSSSLEGRGGKVGLWFAGLDEKRENNLKDP